MPKVNLGQFDYEKHLGMVIRGKVFGRFKRGKEAAKAIGIGESTLCGRYNNPGMMSLNEFKRIIKVVGIPSEEVLNYLYEGKQ